jgi:hypothetical protein
VARASVDSTSPVDRSVTIKTAVRVVVESAVASDRPAGTKRGTGSARSECVARDVLFGLKKSSGSTRTAAVLDDYPARGPDFVRNVKIIGGAVETGVGPASVRPRAPFGILRRYASGHTGSRAPGGGVHGNP